MRNSILNKLLQKHGKPVEKFAIPIPIAAENLQKINGWIDRNRRRRKRAFDKSAISDSLVGSSWTNRLDHTGHYSEKEKEKRKKDAKFWEEHNREFLRQHPEKRGKV